MNFTYDKAQIPIRAGSCWGRFLFGQILLGQIPNRAGSCLIAQTVRADSARADSCNGLLIPVL